MPVRTQPLTKSAPRGFRAANKLIPVFSSPLMNGMGHHASQGGGISECIATSQFDPATDIPMPTGCGRRANYTDWLGKPHEAGAFRGEVRWSDVSRPRRAQVADRRSPVNNLLTNAA